MPLVADLVSARKAQQPQRYPDVALRAAEAERWSMPDYAIAQNQATLYAKLSWVYIAVTTVAEACAVQALNVLQAVGEDTNDIPNHPFELLLRKPRPGSGRFDLLMATFAYRLLNGNSIWWLNKSSPAAAPDELWPIPPHQIKPIPDGRLYIKGWEYDPGGTGGTMILPPESIVHFKAFNPLSTLWGLSPIEAMSTAAESDLAMQKWNRNYFAKNNAKPPGALAFAEMIAQPQWEKMQAEFRRDYGGTERNLMMLRGVGQGGVNWVAMNLSQQDMQFLESRQFTKEEIYSIFGKGLAAILDKNTTEANAQAAKAVFSEFTLWPLLTSVAETITNTILPLYGDNLVAEFDDPRKADRLLDLQEQQEYAKSHTINEVRAEKYGDDALPADDPRGDMLAAEVAPGISHSKAEQEAARQQAAQIAQGGSNAGQVQRGQEQQQGQEGQAVDTSPTAQNAEPGEPAAKAELRRWRDKTRRRGKATDWTAEAIPDPFVEAVKAAMTVLTDPMDAFDFALKATEEWRDEAETDMADALEKMLAKWRRRFADALLANETPPYEEFQAALDSVLHVRVTRVMVNEALKLGTSTGVHFDPAIINTEALNWANAYTYNLVKELRGTTQDALTAVQEKLQGQLRDVLGQWQTTPGMTRENLEALLEPTFGQPRAEMIAITEVTRAASAATNAYQERIGKDAGIRMVRRWQTRNDERTCEICGPLNQLLEDQWADELPDGPPAHPRCRCWTTLTGDKAAE